MFSVFKQINGLCVCVALVLVLIAAMFLALAVGTVKIPMEQIYAAVISQLQSGTSLDGALKGSVHDIVWQLRLPRIVLAAAVGAGLASSGVIMQAIVKNPLADPYILGISSGASLGATAAIFLGIGAFMGENFIGLAAFTGAFAISLLVLFISNLGGRSNSKSFCWQVWRSVRCAVLFPASLFTLPTTRRACRPSPIG